MVVCSEWQGGWLVVVRGPCPGSPVLRMWQSRSLKKPFMYHGVVSCCPSQVAYTTTRTFGRGLEYIAQPVPCSFLVFACMHGVVAVDQTDRVPRQQTGAGALLRSTMPPGCEKLGSARTERGQSTRLGYGSCKVLPRTGPR